MSEIKRALQPAQQPVFEQAANEPGEPNIKLLTELELMLAGGGDTIDPWPK